MAIVFDRVLKRQGASPPVSRRHSPDSLRRSAKKAVWNIGQLRVSHETGYEIRENASWFFVNAETIGDNRFALGRFG